MKTVIIFLLLSFSGYSTNVFSQNYTPLLNQNSVWKYSIPSCGVYEFFKKPSGIDTLINGIIYQEINEYEAYGLQEIKYATIYLRENTIEKKVWIYDTYSNVEILIYDFSKKLNDVFSLGFRNDTLRVIADKDTNTSLGTRRMLILDNISFNYPEIDSIIWIEGTGSLTSMTETTEKKWLDYYTLLCQSENGVPFMGNQDCRNIILSIENKAEINLTNFKIYPNPSSQQITILNSDNSSQFQLNIFDAAGKIFYTNILNHEIKIDVSSYISGLYFVKICDLKSEEISIQKLIIE